MNVVESRKALFAPCDEISRYNYEVFMYNVSMSYNIVCSLASCFQL